jgi:hypothetical protein
MKIEKIAISLLVNDPNNARKHDKKNIMSIKGSLAKFKQQKPLVVDHNNVVLAGNGTLQAALELGWTEIDIVRSDLEGFNATAYGLADNRSSELASWDKDILNATLESLNKADFDLPNIGFGLNDWDQIKDYEVDDDLYSKKIEAPIYEIKGEKPKFSELVDSSKTKQLINEISTTQNLPDDLRSFLERAAQRHTVFNYEKIAEYYANSSPKIQNLMEKSALVIIDFNKAIENGFIVMTKDLATGYLANEDV